MSCCEWKPGKHDLFVALPDPKNPPKRGADRDEMGSEEFPFASIEAAQGTIRQRRRVGWINEPFTVWIKGGVYRLAKPLVFTMDDDFPVTYAAIPGEEVIIDGGKVIEGGVETTVHGKRCFEYYIPEVKSGDWSFRSLFVNDGRRKRAALPKQGCYWMENVPGKKLGSPLFDGSNKFVAAEGDFRADFKNMTEIDVHVFHYWIDEYMPVTGFDPATRTVFSSHQTIFALQDDSQPRYSRYKLDNVYDGLTEEGEWYLDKAEGKLLYLPYADETLENTEIVAPRMEKLVSIQGDWKNEKYIQGLRFSGLHFRHGDWSVCQDPDGLLNIGDKDTFSGLKQPVLASAPQGCSNLPGAINITGAKNIRIEDCTVEHIGFYAINVWRGCTNVAIVGCTLRDMGAGGVKINGGEYTDPLSCRDRYIKVTDCEIVAGGRVFLGGIGVISMHAAYVTIAHNEIHDLYYSGVSIGWTWGYHESVCHSNLVEKNHIYNLGQGMLSDMGGIYTLGIMPHTFLRGNLIHDVEKSNYGGWAIYNDEGSSNIIVENNVCFNTSSNSYHCHYGCENVLRNNIWVNGWEGNICLSRAEKELSLTFERNIVVTKGQPAHVCGYHHTLDKPGFFADNNLYWDMENGADVFSCDNFRRPDEHRKTLKDFQEIGMELHSVIADPMFKDAANDDYSLAEDSPAYAIGFKPIDLSDVGIRPKENRD